MKVLFHENTLALRGTTQAVFDYAHYAQTLLGHECTIAYNASHPENDPDVIAKFNARFSVFPYSDFDALRDLHADLGYVIKTKRNKQIIPDIPTVVHEVFQRFEPHGDVYAYVSEWLADFRTGGRHPFVPHIVTLPPGNSRRAQYGIPSDAFVYGRYGGFETFDLPFVKEGVRELLQDPTVWFVFVNTEKFIDHSRALFLDPITNPTDKSDFILSCDAMVHARNRGESFGLAIAEFLFHGRPVLAWRGGKDGNHRVMLRDAPGALYSDRDDFVAKAKALRDATAFNWSHLVAPYTPAAVMKQFDDVFIKKKYSAKSGSRIWVNLGYRFRRIFGERTPL